MKERNGSLNAGQTQTDRLTLMRREADVAAESAT